MLNVWRLMRQRKASLVYVQSPSRRKFVEVRGQDDWRLLLGLVGAKERQDIERRIRGEAVTDQDIELPLPGMGLHSVGLTE